MTPLPRQARATLRRHRQRLPITAPSGNDGIPLPHQSNSTSTLPPTRSSRPPSPSPLGNQALNTLRSQISVQVGAPGDTAWTWRRQPARAAATDWAHWLAGPSRAIDGIGEQLRAPAHTSQDGDGAAATRQTCSAARAGSGAPRWGDHPSSTRSISRPVDSSSRFASSMIEASATDKHPQSVAFGQVRRGISTTEPVNGRNSIRRAPGVARPAPHQQQVVGQRKCSAWIAPTPEEHR